MGLVTTSISNGLVVIPILLVMLVKVQDKLTAVTLLKLEVKHTTNHGTTLMIQCLMMNVFKNVWLSLTKSTVLMVKLMTKMLQTAKNLMPLQLLILMVEFTELIELVNGITWVPEITISQTDPKKVTLLLRILHFQPGLSSLLF